MGKFNYNEAPENDPIIIEQVWAEKPGGGVVHVKRDIPQGTVVFLVNKHVLGDGEYFEELKYARISFVDQGSKKAQLSIHAHNLEVGDVIRIYYDKDGDSQDMTVARITPPESEHSTNCEIEFKEAFLHTIDDEEFNHNGIFLSSQASYERLYMDGFITGNDLRASEGEYQPCRLINGANLRDVDKYRATPKRTIIGYILEKMSGIHLV